MRRATRRRLLAVGLVFVLSFVLGGALLVYFAPFWLIERMTDVYLFKNGVHQREVLVDGHRIHYLEAAPSENGAAEKPVLLIHGLGARGERLGCVDSGSGTARVPRVCAGPAGVWKVGQAVSWGCFASQRRSGSCPDLPTR